MQKLDLRKLNHVEITISRDYQMVLVNAVVFNKIYDINYV